MSNDNKVLSQEEIDAMLAGGSDDGDDGGDAEIEAPSTPPVPEKAPAPVAAETEPEPEPAAVAEAVAQPTAPETAPEPVIIPEPVAPPPAPSPAPPPTSVLTPEPAPPAATPALAPAQPTPAAPTATTLDNEALNGLTERVGRLETALAESNNNMRQIRQEFQTFATQVQLIGSRMEGVLDNLKSTLGYRAQKTFTCTSCDADGDVAAKVKCTGCGKENWWGWWPQSG